MQARRHSVLKDQPPTFDRWSVQAIGPNMVRVDLFGSAIDDHGPFVPVRPCEIFDVDEIRQFARLLTQAATVAEPRTKR